MNNNIKKDDLVRVDFSKLKDSSSHYVKLIRMATEKGIAKVIGVSETSIQIYKPNTSNWLLGTVAIPVESAIKV